MKPGHASRLAGVSDGERNPTIKAGTIDSRLTSNFGRGAVDAGITSELSLNFVVGF